MKTFKILLKTLFTKTELFLMQNNREFLLAHDTQHKVQPAKQESKEVSIGAHYKYLLQQARPKYEHQGLKELDITEESEREKKI